MSDSPAASLLRMLQEPFALSEISFRVGRVARNGKRASVLTYIDARAAMDRFDEVLGIERWKDSYRVGPSGGQICRIELLLPVREEPVVAFDGFGEDGGPKHIHVNRTVWEWVGKEDAAENTQIEGVKGGISDAFKRAAVKWGVGRYLYRIPDKYYPINLGSNEWANGRGIDVSTKADGHIGWIPTPQLQPWALPAPGRKETKSETETRRNAHDPEWESGGQQRFMAQIGELGLKYDVLKWWLASRSKRKPSVAPRDERDALVTWLGDPQAPARIARIQQEYDTAHNP